MRTAAIKAERRRFQEKCNAPITIAAEKESLITTLIPRIAGAEA